MSHLQKTEKWRTEKRTLMLELLDNPRTGLKESSDTNKTRMELLGILDEMTQIATQSVEAERERILNVPLELRSDAFIQAPIYNQETL